MSIEMISKKIKNEELSAKDNNKPSVEFLGLEVAKKVREFHKSFPIYKETPLVNLKNLSKMLGVSNIYIKDESYRFGLNAFKVLGGSYAIGNYIAERLGVNIEELSYDKIVSKEVKEKLGDVTFISATDGNHGRGVAWTAKELGQKSVIYMPKGSAEERLLNIRALGAEAEITDLNYDDAVRLADKHGKENGWTLVQDTSWTGYEEIPINIMQGYTTMGLEAYEQLQGKKPTHIFLQAGVGSYATAITGLFADIYKEDKPIITIVEPKEAACIFKTIKANDGEIHPVTGDMKTIMAGLACGEPITVGIDILRSYVENFISCDDYVAADGMRILAAPLKGDEKVISGESGAATLGFLYEVLTNPSLEELKNKLELKQDSVILLFNTEGDTDKENYKNIVWHGAYGR